MSVEASRRAQSLRYQQTIPITSAGSPAHGITSVSETVILISQSSFHHSSFVYLCSSFGIKVVNTL